MLCNGAASQFGTALNTFFTNLVNIGSFAGLTIATAFVLWAGFLRMTSQGNVRQMDQAKTALINALIGYGLVIGAQVVATMIKTALGC